MRPALVPRLTAAFAPFRRPAAATTAALASVAGPRRPARPSASQSSLSELAAAQAALACHRVAIFIVAFNAERFIEGVLQRIPAEIRDLFAEIYVIDDFSSDATFDVAIEAGRALGFTNLVVLRTPFNRGYGGNQKLGYLHAVKRDFDYVVLLHGDGQYAPECLPRMLAPLVAGNVDVVIGSRMMHRLDALKGGMPLYKWVGNQVLTAIQNRALGSSLSEFHSGYRVYRVDRLKELKFQLNSDEFHFDTELLIQFLATRGRIAEVPIPTFYGDEISHVNGLRYAWNCLKALAKYRLTQLGLFYEPNFDFKLFEEKNYTLKRAPNSLHQLLLRQPWDPDWQVVDLGANDGELSGILAQRVKRVVSVDVREPSNAGAAVPVALDLNSLFEQQLGSRTFDSVVALDVVEHLDAPERAVESIFRLLKPGGRLYASTGNIAFLALRLSLLVGQFNYGKRGILDLTHTRLFTVYSFTKLLTQAGFVVRDVRYFGPPIADMVGDTLILRVLDAAAGFAARAWPSVFAYSFLVVADRADDLEDIYRRTAATGLLST